MRELPTGTVTLLFTDIEGSTRLLHELGDRYAEVLAEHRRLLRDAFQSHGGVEVDTQGDAFFYAFPTAQDALSAAAAAQTALADGSVRVRIGVHTGEPVVTDEGYVGLDVHHAARVMASGHGGQVLVSEAAQRQLDGGLELRDLGLQRLKDLLEPEHLYQLGDGAFPPLKTLNATNLPTQPTPLVGRDRELAELAELLGRDDIRLVTLTGTGGTGKTRLALQVAAESVDVYKDGVFWISLAAVTDPELVLPTVASALGAKTELAEHIGERRMLLLLDNLEQVAAAGPALGDLLRACRNLRLLVTSRALLRIAGEWEYALDPLPEVEAIELFLERARAAGRKLEADETVLAICRRLDCLPLALELAAARTNLLPPKPLLARLEHSLDLLTTGGPGSARAPAHLARDDPVELRPARRGGGGAVPAPRSLRRLLFAGGGRAGLRCPSRRACSASGQQPLAANGRGPLLLPGDDRGVRGRASPGERRRRGPRGATCRALPGAGGARGC